MAQSPPSGNGAQPSGNQLSAPASPPPVPQHAEDVIGAVEHAMLMGAQKAAAVQTGDEFAKFCAGIADLAKALGSPQKPAPGKVPGE